MSLPTENNTCRDCGSINTRKLRRRVIRNGAIQYVMQCQICGAGGNPIAKARALSMNNGAEPAAFDEEIRPTYDRERRAAFDQQRQESRHEFFEWYDQYLASPEWKERRRKVLLRAQGICEGCRDAAATEVHHLTYDNVGEEFLWQLVAICHECHERYHEADQARRGRIFLEEDQ